jgi:hypothetical protein
VHCTAFVLLLSVLRNSTGFTQLVQTTASQLAIVQLHHKLQSVEQEGSGVSLWQLPVQQVQH